MQIVEDIIINNNISIDKKMRGDEELKVGVSVFDIQSQQVLNSLPGLKEFIIEPIEIPYKSIVKRVQRLKNL